MQTLPITVIWGADQISISDVAVVYISSVSDVRFKNSTKFNVGLSFERLIFLLIGSLKISVGLTIVYGR